ncbi:hypothetical protein ASB62_07360 [Chlorobium limicola]|uniref:Uncharacterized protein n=1 Tax=Chlorobium limicola TaxID=1092 RepID=A0A101JAA5_CHLLI|nr:hypothetical protein ASB62_07360 [Chlorobium limicola]
MVRGDEERRKRLNRGRFAHEFPRIYTNWRLFVNGKVFQDCRGDYNSMVVLNSLKLITIDTG